jgi:LuxR family transcriptional regulator, maltose regulon positive regulatory protein
LATRLLLQPARTSPAFCTPASNPLPTEREPLNPRLILKATPPKGSRSLLARPRLSLNSSSFADKCVISICASAGMGKTALLTQWRREAIAQGNTVAWLTIDQWDDGARLVEGLIHAISVATSTSLQPHDFKASNTGIDPFENISFWLTRVAAFAGEVLLILDDVHYLPQQASDSLAFLLHHMPANLRVILASRKPLPFPVYELMSKGMYASLNNEVLRLQLSETTTLLQTRFGNRIDADTCARLHQLTEGWPLGLQLAISSIDQQASIREAVSTLLVHSGDSHRFFVEALLKRLDQRDADFLVAVSFLDALHPELCQAVTGAEDSPAILDRLCEMTPIMIEGVNSSWLIIHALAREFLSETFDALPEAKRQHFYSAAANWLAANGFHEEAARHALSSGQEDLALDLAERSLYQIYLTGQVARIAQWIDRLGVDRLQQRPRLRLAMGWALAKIEHHAEVAEVVGPILNDLGADIVDRFECILILTTAALYADRPDKALELLTPWRQQVAGFNPIQRQITANLDALLILHQGQPEQARFLLSQPEHQDISAGRYATGGRDWLIAASYLWQGQVIAAEAILRNALAEVEPVAGRRSPIATMLAVTLAGVLWERGEPQEIGQLLADRRDVIDQYTMPDVIAQGYLVGARAILETEGMSKAHDMLERLFILGKTRRMLRLCVISLVEQMRLSAMQQREQSCASLAERLTQVVAEGNTLGWGMLQRFIDIQLGMAQAYRQLVAGNWAQVRVALATAKPLAEQLRRNKDLLQIHLLDALAARHLGEDADGIFRESLFIIDTLGLKRLLADTHPELVEWDKGLRNQDGRLERVAAPAPAVAATQPPRVASEARQIAPSILLTPKERDVLRLLASNLSNKEIAMGLDLSVQTVKWHLKNLFGKLNAGSRKHLVDRARILGILLD